MNVEQAELLINEFLEDRMTDNDRIKFCFKSGSTITLKRAHDEIEMISNSLIKTKQVDDKKKSLTIRLSFIPIEELERITIEYEGIK